MFAFVMILAATTTSARAGITYYTQASSFFTDPADPYSYGFQMAASGGGFLTPTSLTNQSMFLLGVLEFSTTTNSSTITNYNTTIPPQNAGNTMGGPIATNISTTIVTPSGSGTIKISGLLTGGADYLGSNLKTGSLQVSLTFASSNLYSNSVTIGNQVYTMNLLALPGAVVATGQGQTSTSDFTTNVNSGYDVADGNIYAQLIITPTGVPEPGSLAMLLIGGGVLGSGAWARRRQLGRSARASV